MEHEEVIRYVKEFFAKEDYKVRLEYKRGHQYVDILAEKKEAKYFIEAIGDRRLDAQPIKIAIGQIAAEMSEVGPNIYYAVALSATFSEYLKDFGIEGIKALNLHLFIVGDSPVWEGYVLHLEPQDAIRFVKKLEIGADDAFLSLFSLKKPV